MGVCAMDWGGSGGRVVYIEDMYNAGAVAIYLALTTHVSQIGVLSANSLLSCQE